LTRKNVELFTKHLESQLGKPDCPLSKADVKAFNAKAHHEIDKQQKRR
jgi:hypothetical protein